MTDPNAIRTIGAPTTSAWQQLRRIHTHVARHLDAALNAHCAIDLSTYEILDRIHHHPGVTRINDLYDTVPLSQPALSRRIERLEGQGLIKRQPDQRDRRGAILTLTSAGRNMHTIATPVHQAGINRHLHTYLATT